MNLLNNFLPLAKSSLAKYFSLLLFSTITISLFVYLNRIQPHYFIDEAFHIPQTLRYCSGNLTEWDPKITTLPGLYFITALILSPFNLCTVIHIRSINLIGTFLNLYLIYNIIKKIHKSSKKFESDNWIQFTVAYNITLFPPLYFWCFFYYTDVISVNIVLLMLYLHLCKHLKTAAFAGLLAVCVRQTNIIWVAFVTMEHVLNMLDDHLSQKSVSPTYCNNVKPLDRWKNLLHEIFYKPRLFTKFLIKICTNIYPYIIVCFIFVIFLIWNKGIVVGDRAAHVPTIHIPQLFYYSTFLSMFSWPYVIVHWQKFVHFIQERWILASHLFLLVTLIVHYNTLVHPYVLADNRHYTFYVWNRFMNRYLMFKYLVVPVYCFTLYAMLYNISHLRITSQISYIGSVCLVLIPQLLLEPRYFIIPYIFYRLYVQKPDTWQILMEFLTTLVVNFLQFFIFANKVFYWDDQTYSQRISW